MHILVTGASSFVGSHIAQHFLQIGHDVTATYRTRNTAVGKLLAGFSGPSLQMVELDLSSASSYTALPTTAEVVVHVAGVSPRGGVSTAELLSCNVQGMHNLIRHALDTNARKFIFTSTLSIHGSVRGSILDENTPVINPDIYGASKYLAERMLAAVSEQIPSVAVRLPGVLGAGAHRAWLPVLLDKMSSNRDVTIYNPDAAFNNAAHVSDLGIFLADLMRQDWKGFLSFPVGASGKTSISKVVHSVRAGLGSKSKIVIDPTVKPGFIISSDRAVALGYRPMDINAMIERYVLEYKSSEA
ncbi:MAG: NAD(P)-dependent oxidoreductase [Xanthobacteraceae bacterium]